MRTPRKKGDGVPGPNCPDLYRDRALKGGQSSKARTAVYLIEGEYVTYEQIAERLGLSVTAAKHRFNKAKARPGAVTWEGMQP